MGGTATKKIVAARWGAHWDLLLMLYSIGTAEARVRGVLHFSKVFFSFFTFVKKVIFSLACVCLSVCLLPDTITQECLDGLSSYLVCG